jgi:Nickel responsive protein SCO4226-like
MVYIVERYLPGLNGGELLRGLHQSTHQHAGDNSAARYLGSTIVIGDDACYCHFEASSPAAVIDANRFVGLPVDRIVAVVTVTPSTGEHR